MTNYVMYGYCISDVDKTGYLAKIPRLSSDECVLTDELSSAKKFNSENREKVAGFGSPKKWLKFVNEEFAELYGKDAYKFHLVKTSL